MKTEALDKCLGFIRNWPYLDLNDHHQLFIQGDSFGESHIEPLRRELVENLITLDHQQQTNVIIFYVNELNRIAITDYFEEFEKRETKDEKGNLPKVIQLKQSSELEGPFFHMIYHLHLLLFMEIDKVCKIYNIPLNKILQDQGIDLNTLFIETVNVTLENSGQKPLPDIRPRFTAEFIPEIFDILKDFFSESDQLELLKLLQTGDNSNHPLLFLDAGSRLADALKQLYDCAIIKGCMKKELEEWICNNFCYRHRNTVKVFTNRYVADIISTTKDKCQKPILNVNQDKSTGQYLITKV
ncbi:MAG: hypothetical protein HQ542_13120 [Bacteroidia bacterium]|nr:hypothetical protein [Bacteroidia bacterium]